MEINYKVYAQKVSQLEQTFEGLGAKLQKRVDLPYFDGNWGWLKVKNKEKVKRLLRTDFGFIKHYRKGYILDIWKFPAKWKDIYPFNSRSSLSWKEYYILIMEIKMLNGEVLIAENITGKCNNLDMLITRIDGSIYYTTWYSNAFARGVSPFFWHGASRPKEKISCTYKIWVDLEDIKDLGSIDIKLEDKI